LFSAFKDVLIEAAEGNSVVLVAHFHNSLETFWRRVRDSIIGLFLGLIVYLSRAFVQCFRLRRFVSEALQGRLLFGKIAVRYFVWQ